MHHIHTILEVDSKGYGFAFSGLEGTLREGEANSALIAAAPELLQALVIAEEFMCGFEGDEAQTGLEINLAIVRQAIAKARGEYEQR